MDWVVCASQPHHIPSNPSPERAVPTHARLEDTQCRQDKDEPSDGSIVCEWLMRINSFVSILQLAARRPLVAAGEQRVLYDDTASVHSSTIE